MKSTQSKRPEALWKRQSANGMTLAETLVGDARVGGKRFRGTSPMLTRIMAELARRDAAKSSRRASGKR